MKKFILISGVLTIGLLVSYGTVVGKDCSYYQDLITYYENSIKEYQDLAAGYSASIASQMSAQGLGYTAIASASSTNPYFSTINDLEGKLLKAKTDYTNCQYSSSSSSSNYNYDSIMNSQKALDYVERAMNYIEYQVNAYTKQDYKNAIKNAEKAVENLKKANDYDNYREEALFIEYGDLGWLYCLNSEYSKGKTYLKKSYNYTKDSDTKGLYNSCLKLEKYGTSSTTTNTSTSTRPCSQYGSHAFLDNNVNKCYCEDGYTWNKGHDTCVTYDESCKSYFGEYSIPDPSIKYSCLCKDGYEFSSDGSKCIKSSNNINNSSYKNYNNKYSDEYNKAYEYAYSNNITTMPTIEQANMNGEIIRAEIAKMLSNRMKSLGYTPNTSKSCNFKDISSVKGDLYTAIIESCQLGIMGQGITNFRPYDKITKGEVSTAVSRIIRGSKYEGGNPYYDWHMKVLKSSKVLDSIDNANVNELRGNVMTILMKVSNNILTKINKFQNGAYYVSASECYNKDGEKEKNPTVDNQGNIINCYNSNLKREGKRIYDENGTIINEGYYINGESEGKWIYYYGDGQIKAELNLANNEGNGKTINYYENGQIKMEGITIGGYSEGKWIYYNENGQIKEEKIFKNGYAVN